MNTNVNTNVNKFVPLNDKSNLPKNLLEIVLAYDPSSNYYLSKEEKVHYKPKMTEVSSVAIQMILNKDMEGLEDLTNQSKYNEAVIADIFSHPYQYFKVLDDETKNGLYHMIDNNDRFMNYTNVKDLRKVQRFLDNLERGEEFKNGNEYDNYHIDTKRKLKIPHEIEISKSPYGDFVLSKRDAL